MRWPLVKAPQQHKPSMTETVQDEKAKAEAAQDERLQSESVADETDPEQAHEVDTPQQAATEDENMVPSGLVGCVEALLMAADRPLSINRLVSLLEAYEAPDRAAIRMALQALSARYAQAAVDLVEVADGWRFQVGADYSDLVTRLWEEKPPKLSRAMLETLSLICYRQPIARSEIEQVRGVSVSSSIIKTLQEYEWIKVVAYREVPGRPALFGTTPQFLSDFGVKQLDDLPSLPEIKDLEALDAAVEKLQDESAEQSEDRNAREGPDTSDRPEDESSGTDVSEQV